MKTLKRFVLIGAPIFLASACATLPPSEIDPAWHGDVRVAPLGAVHLMDESQRLVVSSNKSVYLIDANDGQRVAAFPESFWDAFLRAGTSVDVEVQSGRRTESVSLDSLLWSDVYDIAALEASSTFWMFDYRKAQERIVAVDARSGEQLWASSDYAYSLNKYEGLIQEAAGRAGRALAGALGAQHEAETPETRRARLAAFMERVVHEIPGSQDVFFKTFDGLLLMDPRTGRVKARFADFQGAGIADVHVLPGGDYLVLSGHTSIGELSLSQGNSLARIRPNGQLRWLAQHSGRRTGGLIVEGDIALVDGSPLEAFDLRHGNKLWQAANNRRDENDHHVVVDGGSVYIASAVAGGTAGALGGMLGDAAVIPEAVVERRDLRTGERRWASAPARGQYNGLTVHQGTVLVTGHGRIFGGSVGVRALSADTGGVLWQQEDLASTWRTGPMVVSPPIVKGDLVIVVEREQVNGLDLATGEQRYRLNHADAGTGLLLGTVQRNDMLVVIGSEATLGLDMRQGTRQYATPTDRVSHYSLHGASLVLKSGQRNAQRVNLDSGTSSPVVRLGNGRTYFGDLSDGFAIDGDARQAIGVNEEGKLHGYLF
ncbi:PQQ-like beta-propeller repeat protein [Alcanivorax sp. JB21]|uniref:outer membrane protein assembly factor BamB family protein n=1 Tax=Alcanivorax limicola TaxID=2874102 RepID=UPI001CBDA3EE|nr:PQQ-binding-like beta-propeller repeat protein [Alcanivorax limicola]MBZ2188061.1 PQQ-like beta-propeller repeat protein [Alcanivorax limicola]